MAIATCSISGGISITETSTTNTSGSVRNTVAESVALALTNGTGAAGTADKVYSASRTATAAADVLDLAGGISDAFGVVITLARLKSLFIWNQHATAILTVGAGSTPISTMLGATGTIIIRPGGFLLIGATDATAYAITAATADLLKIDPGASTVTYRIVLVGSTA